MAFTEPRVDDARGRRVPAVDQLAAAPRWPWKVPPRRWLSPGARRWMYIESASGLGVIALAVVMSVIVAGASSQRVSLIGIVTLLGAMALYFVINQLHNWHWTGPGRSAAAHAMAREGVCPSCGYGLTGVPENEHGFTTCPECASDWRLG